MSAILAVVFPVCKLRNGATCFLTASVAYLLGLVCEHCCQVCLSFEHLYFVPVCNFFLVKLQVSFSLTRSQVPGFCQLISMSVTQRCYTAR